VRTRITTALLLGALLPFGCGEAPAPDTDPTETSPTVTVTGGENASVKILGADQEEDERIIAITTSNQFEVALEDIENDDDNIRYTALRDIVAGGLEAKGEKLEKAVEISLLVFRTDPSERMRQAAAVMLGRLAEDAGAAVPGLIECLDEEDKRVLAMETLPKIGEAAKDAVPVLMDFLDEPDADLRRRAARALGSYGPIAAEALPRLIEALERDAAMEVRQAAAGALGGFGAKGIEALPALRRAAQPNQPPRLRIPAEMAVEAIEKAAGGR
jgi:HEAT repeat protein